MYTIRRALPSDAVAVGELVLGLVGDSLTDPTGDEAASFYKTLAQERSPDSYPYPIGFTQLASRHRLDDVNLAPSSRNSGIPKSTKAPSIQRD